MRTTLHLFVMLIPALGLIAPALGADPPGDKSFVNSVGMKMVRIEAGRFVMGQGEAPPKSRDQWDQRDWDEAPAHAVNISQPFYMGACEVTNAQFEQYDAKHKAMRGFRNISGGDNDPVVYITWQQAVDFCDWLARKEGRPYRLPTEAQWEYTCRAGTQTIYNTGDTLTPAQANFGVAPDGQKRISAVAVGSYAPNAWGLYDMHGNVDEWVHDWYGPYVGGEQTDPVGRADGLARVCRGWSYNRVSNKAGAVRYCRSANRSGHLPHDSNRYTGFRVVIGEMPGTAALPPYLPPFQKDVKQGPAPTDGPDPAAPYFNDFDKTSKLARVPDNWWGPVFTRWNHYGACTWCPNGDILAVWYTCTQESGRECSQAMTRLRAGAAQWDPVESFISIPDTNTHAPTLFCDGKRVYHFATQSLHGWDHASNIMRYSDDNGQTWSKPQIILHRDSAMPLSQPCSALLTRSGTLVLACDGDGHRDERLMLSDDRGRTWRVAQGDMRKACGAYAIHPAVVQRDDGKLMAFLRGPNPMPVLVSSDLGATWQHHETPFPGISVGQKAAALKLKSGALLLCSFDSKRELFGGGVFAALSLDDGKTWPHVRKVDGAFGYMALTQAPNGVIYLLGPSGPRNPSRAVAFNEAWLKQGKPLAKAGK